MKTTSVLLLASAIGAKAVPQGLTEVPKLPAQQGPGCAQLPAGLMMGVGVETRPQDIPSGCSAFEVLVGALSIAELHQKRRSNNSQLEEPVSPTSRRAMANLVSLLATH